MFANPSTQDKPLSGYHVLLKLEKESGVSNTTLFTSTRLRKHIATVLQVLNISDTEKEQFASFMGHTKKTHETFYSLPQDVFQTAKVSKLLLAINSGKASKENKLEEIDVGQESLSSDSEDDQHVANKKKLYSNEENKMKPVQSNYWSESDLKDKGTTNESLVIPDTSAKPVKQKIVRKRYSEEQKRVMLEYFKEHIKNKIPPKQAEVMAFMEQDKDTFKDLTWVKIKAFVYNAYRER